MLAKKVSRHSTGKLADCERQTAKRTNSQILFPLRLKIRGWRAQIKHITSVDNRSKAGNWAEFERAAAVYDVVLRREGCNNNAHKIYRIHKAWDKPLTNKTPRRWSMERLQKDCKDAVAPNGVWAMSFVHDELATRRKIQILRVV